MSKKLSVVVFGLFLIVIISGGLSAEGYLLKCKGGELTMHVNGSELRVIVTLKRAVSHTSIGMGECAWLDRPLNQNESPNLELILKRAALTIANYKADFSTGQIAFPDIDHRLRKIILGMRDKTEYILKVKNDSGRFLTVL